MYIIAYCLILKSGSVMASQVHVKGVHSFSNLYWIDNSKVWATNYKLNYFDTHRLLNRVLESGWDYYKTTDRLKLDTKWHW